MCLFSFLMDPTKMELLLMPLSFRKTRWKYTFLHGPYCKVFCYKRLGELSAVSSFLRSQVVKAVLSFTFQSFYSPVFRYDLGILIVRKRTWEECDSILMRYYCFYISQISECTYIYIYLLVQLFDQIL